MLDPPQDLRGRTFYLSGTFQSHTHRSLRSALEHAGAIVLRGRPDPPPDVVVVGSHPSRSIDPLLGAGARRWDEWQLLAALGMSDSVSNRAERLRDLVGREPSASAWKAVCAELTRWPANELNVAIDYLEPYLLEWPDTLRVARKGWAAGVLSHGADPRLRLVSRLNLFDRGVSSNKAVRFAQSPDVRNITWLNMSWNKVGDSGAAALVQSPHLARLRCLDLSHNRVSRARATELLERDDLKRIEELDFGALGGRRKANAPPPWRKLWGEYIDAHRPIDAGGAGWYEAPKQTELRPPRGLTLLGTGSGKQWHVFDAAIDWDQGVIHFAEVNLRDGLTPLCRGLVERIEFREEALSMKWPCSTRATYRFTCPCGFTT